MRDLPHFSLVMAWADARAQNLVGAAVGPCLAASAHIGFWGVPIGLIFAREIVTGRSWRNLPVVAVVTGLGVSCALSQTGTLGLGMAEFGRRLGFGVVFVLMGRSTVVSGRASPARG